MKPASARDESDDAELDLLLDEIYRRYHYDFRQYARPSLLRRVAQAQSSLGCPSLAELLERVICEPATFTKLLRYLTVCVSDFFRDPDYHRALRESVIPHLATYPSLRIWVAGCGTGEEAYSIGIILHEAGLLERSRVYATDIDSESLGIAERGTYDLERAREFGANYLRAGGRGSILEYCTTGHSRVAFRPELREHIVFADHSLATDSAFAEVQLVSCRNVLIYFDRTLQDRSIDLFRESLCPRGFLGLGASETLGSSDHLAAFEPFAECERIYRKR